MVIYQLMPRWFTNKRLQTVFNGSLEENGCGKLEDIDYPLLEKIKSLGATHIWLTGIIRHASLTDYSKQGLTPNHPQIVKGKAGSPYAITDYYDVHPDLTTDIGNRLGAWKELVKRIHKTGMKVIIDFVPNHVAREYDPKMQPKPEMKLGTGDDPSQAFLPNNNFYYLPGQDFQAPTHHTAGMQTYVEQPAKATGNDRFVPNPGIDDWYETIKLNYGIDYLNNKTRHFDPIPDTWFKILDILEYWTGFEIDGFRCDMAEMVPFEFWRWAISRVKEKKPGMLFIGEAYSPDNYVALTRAGFDILYDKSGVYDKLFDIVSQGHDASGLSEVLRNHAVKPEEHLLYFLENHDEPRIASTQFAGHAEYGRPAWILLTTLPARALLLYAGQETGEPATGAQGYSGDDGRTSIFDYIRVPELQKSLFHPEQLSESQQSLMAFYHQTLNIRKSCQALQTGAFYDLMWAHPWHQHFDPRHLYTFLRYTEKEIIWVIINFDKTNPKDVFVRIPKHACYTMNRDINGSWKAIDMLEDKLVFEEKVETITQGFKIQISALQSYILKITPC